MYEQIIYVPGFFCNGELGNGIFFLLLLLSEKQPNNPEHWAGMYVYWCLKREHHQVILPKLCSPLCLIAPPSVDDHWRCAGCPTPRLHHTGRRSGTCPASALVVNVPPLGLVTD